MDMGRIWCKNQNTISIRFFIVKNLAIGKRKWYSLLEERCCMKAKEKVEVEDGKAKNYSSGRKGSS